MLCMVSDVWSKKVLVLEQDFQGNNPYQLQFFVQKDLQMCKQRSSKNVSLTKKAVLEFGHNMSMIFLMQHYHFFQNIKI